MEIIPEILAAFAFFGAIFVCPLVWMLMKHQRAMAEIVHKGSSHEALERLEALEREVRDLRAAHNDRVLAQEDQRELTRRTSQ